MSGERNQPQLFAEPRADLFAPMLDARRLRDLHQPARRNARSVPQRMRELFLAHRLEQVADGFGLERFDGVLIVGGREDHGRRIFQRVDVARDLDAGQAGHAHVEQHDVGTQLAAAARALPRRCRLRRRLRSLRFRRAAAAGGRAPAARRRRSGVSCGVHGAAESLPFIAPAYGKISRAQNSPLVLLAFRRGRGRARPAPGAGGCSPAPCDCLRARRSRPAAGSGCALRSATMSSDARADDRHRAARAAASRCRDTRRSPAAAARSGSAPAARIGSVVDVPMHVQAIAAAAAARCADACARSRSPPCSEMHACARRSGWRETGRRDPRPPARRAPGLERVSAAMVFMLLNRKCGRMRACSARMRASASISMLRFHSALT